MKKFKPYNIAHLNLARNQNAPILETSNHGNYLVFWWDQFALGHLFLEPGMKLTEDDFYKKLIHSISPCIEYNKAKNKIADIEWRQWILKEEFEKWKTWMNSLFVLPNSIPEKVPVSVIICTRNRSLQLKNCLIALQKLDCLPQEIIVVDNNPSDTASELVVKEFDNIKYVLEKRVGLDIARNSGIKKATMPIVAYIDDDVLVSSYLIYNIWQTFENPSISAMTGLVFAAELSTEAQYIFEKSWSFNRGFVDKFYDLSYFQKTLKEGPPVWEIGAGANMAFRKSIFEKVGFFDERLDVGAAGCNGDSEMWYRILAAGETIHYNPRAIVYHEHRKQIKDLKKQLFYYMRGFAAAAMIQQKQVKEAGYKHKLFVHLPKYYLRLFVQGFPYYRLRFCSLWVEIKGVLSGISYYRKNKKLSNKVII